MIINRAQLLRSLKHFFNRFLRRPYLWLLGAIFLLSFIEHCLLNFLVGSIVLFDTTVPEGSIVYSVQAIGEGALYRDYQAPPHATTPYTPIYYYLTFILSKIIPVDGIDSIYYAGRLISYLSLLGSAALVGRLARHTGTSRSWSWGAFFVALTVRWLLVWSCTCRPDLLGICFSIAGVACYVCAQANVGKFSAMLLFLLAIFTKQSLISAPGAVALTLVLQKKWADLVRLVAIVGGGVCASVFALNFFTGGLFYQNIVVGNLAPVIFDQPGIFLWSFCCGAIVPIFFGGLGLLALRSSEGGAKTTILQLYVVTSLAWALITSLKAGANLNYFVEPAFAIAMFSGLGLQTLYLQMRRKETIRVLGFAVLLLLFEFSRSRTWWIWFTDRPFMVSRSPVALINKELEQYPGDILFDDSGLAVHSGRNVLLLDNFNASYLADAGKINFEELVGRLERQEISAVVTRRSIYDHIHYQLWWPRSVAFAINDRYSFAGQIGHHFRLYLPNDWPRKISTAKDGQEIVSPSKRNS